MYSSDSIYLDFDHGRACVPFNHPISAPFFCSVFIFLLMQKKKRELKDRNFVKSKGTFP